MTHMNQFVLTNTHPSGKLKNYYLDSGYDEDTLDSGRANLESHDIEAVEIEMEIEDYGILEKENNSFLNPDHTMTFIHSGAEELLIHQQNAAVLSPEELTAFAQQMEHSRLKLSSLIINSDFGLQAIAGEFIKAIGDGVDVSELLRKINSEAVQNEDFAQDTAKQLTSKLLDCFHRVLSAKADHDRNHAFSECRLLLDELHFLPNFLQQIVKLLNYRIRDRAFNNKDMELLKSAAFEQHQMISARRTMISGNLRLVTFIARQYNHSAVPLSDLIQDGTVGLIKAVDRFDWRRSVRFSTYAIYWIKQSITRGMVRQEKMVRLPYNIAAKAAAVFEAMNNYMVKNNHWPSNEKLAEICGLPEEEIKAIVDNYQPIVSLDNNINDDEDLPAIVDSIEQHHFPQPIKLLANSALKNCLRKAIESLPEREADIINCRFGLDRDTEMTLQDIADRMCLTRERVRQIQNNALQKIKNKFSHDLVDFLEPG